MRPLVLWGVLLVALLLACLAWWLAGGGSVEPGGASPGAAPAREEGPDRAAASEPVALPEEAPRAAVEPQSSTPSPVSEIEGAASIVGTVTRQRVRYHHEIVERVRAGFAADAIPTPQELEEAWKRLGIPLEERVAEPLEGARVVVTSEPARGERPIELQAITDATGGFLLEALPAGRYRVRLVLPGDAPRLLPDDRRVLREVLLDSAEQETVAFELPGVAASVRGRVLGTEGRPIEGAEVTATCIVDVLHDDSWGYGDVRRLDEVRDRSNEQGCFRLEGLLPSSFQESIGYARAPQRSSQMVVVEARATDHVPARMLVLPLTEELDQAACSMLDSLYDWAQAVGPPEWLTFELGPPYLDAVRPRFDEGTQLLPDLVLERSASISGRVEGTDGEPRPSVEVSARPAEEPEPGPLIAAPVLPGWVRADARGAFHIPDLPGGAYTFEVRSEEAGLQVAANPPLEVDAGTRLQDVVVTVRADEKGILQGTAVDASTGEPLETFKVEVDSTQGWTIVDGQGGAFRIEKVQEGPATLLFHARGYASEPLECVVRGGETTELHAQLARAGNLRGFVTLDGEVARGVLSVYADDGSDAQVHYGWFEDDYQTKKLRPGRPYRLVMEVELARGGRSKLVAHAVVVPPSEEDTELDLRLERPAATLEGSVRAAEPLQSWFVYALEGATAGLEEPSRSRLLRGVAEGKGSEEGFELALEPGTYTLVLRVLRKDASGGPPSREDQLTTVVVAEGEPTRVELQAP